MQEIKEDKFKERNTLNGEKYNSPIYGVKKEEFEFCEQLYKFERRAFWKGVLISALVLIGILIIADIIK